MVPARPDSEETCRLLERIQRGDGSAFEELFARHRALLRRLVELRLDARLRTRVDASDVVQDAHLEAFRRLPDFLERKPMPFRLWLQKTAQERLRMIERQHLEASRRAVGRERGPGQGGWEAPAPQLEAPGPSPSQNLAEGELADRVRAAISRLTDPDQDIVLMRTFEGLSYDEIACLLDIDAATARKRHGRALLRLHKLLVDGGLTESEV